MKKILIFIIFFFVFSTNAFALKIDEINIDVKIDANGDAEITEIWKIPSQDITYFEKEFYDVSNAKISDYKITDKMDTKNPRFKEVKKWDKSKEFTYYFKDSKNRKKIMISTNGLENIYTISYKVKGIITKFKDGVYGINWYFLVNSKTQEVRNIDIYLKGATSYNETNTALYAIGKNLSAEFKDGLIHLSAKNIDNKTQIKLITTFTDIEYKNAINNSNSFDEVYKDSLKGITFIDEMLERVTGETIKTIIFVLVVIIIILVAGKIISLLKKRDEYSGIESSFKEDLPKLENIKYYDAVPCNKDLYKIAFIAGYFKILKNRTDLIGSILLKWIYNGNAEIVLDKYKPYIKLNNDKKIDNKLDKELYNILKKASSNNNLTNSKLSRYATENYNEVIDWFNNSFNEIINIELEKGNIKKNKKSLVLSEKILNEAKLIQGLKKYLLNFNQVPRQTELTKERYKYLLIVAELLGIGGFVAKEILRKNSDNEMAKILLDFQTVKNIYKGIYSIASLTYKQKSKKK